MRPHHAALVAALPGVPDRPTRPDPPDPNPIPSLPVAQRLTETDMAKRFVLRDTLRTHPAPDGKPGRYLSVEPGKDRVSVRTQKPTGGWEAVELKLSGVDASARFVDADRVLSVNPQGGLETRAADAVGEWERFATATQPGGRITLTRWQDGVVLALFEAEPLG
jgi:hypothetical protein